MKEKRSAAATQAMCIEMLEHVGRSTAFNKVLMM
jgi:hypothetical protein